MKTVAAISFLDNHSISMDVEGVRYLEMTNPVQIDENTWVCEVLVRNTSGTLAMQLMADSPEKLKINIQG